jgi:hypothetical protein
MQETPENGRRVSAGCPYCPRPRIAPPQPTLTFSHGLVGSRGFEVHGAGASIPPRWRRVLSFVRGVAVALSDVAREIAVSRMIEKRGLDFGFPIKSQTMSLAVGPGTVSGRACARESKASR